MSARHDILQRVRANAPAGRDLPAVPTLAQCSDPGAHGMDLLPTFTTALERMGGRVVEQDDDLSLDQHLAVLFPNARVVVSATEEVRGTRSIDSAREDPRVLEDVDVGVVRAAFGVAETGSLALSEHEFVVPAIGFLPQHLVVLLDPRTLLPDLHSAYRQRGFFAAGYATLMTGPSATADIEGVLVRGAQGVRSFTVILGVP